MTATATKTKINKKDLFKVIAYFNVYGLQIYGLKYHGLDAGKNNLEGYFCDKLGWSFSRLKRTCKILRDAGVIDRKPSDVDCTLYAMSSLYKSFLLFVEE